MHDSDYCRKLEKIDISSEKIPQARIVHDLFVTIIVMVTILDDILRIL